MTKVDLEVQVAEATELRIELDTCFGIAMDKYLRIQDTQLS